MDGIGALLQHDGGLTVATANSEEGRLVEDLEQTLAEGPCVEAAREGTQVLVGDLTQHADRWPNFVPRALDAGIRSVHALPLTARQTVVGVLDIVAREPVSLSDDEVATAQVLADVATAYITNHRVRHETSELASQLQRALDSRVVIEQAKGVLAERHGEEPGRAFERLRSHARSTRASVRDVATAVVEGSVQL